MKPAIAQMALTRAWGGLEMTALDCASQFAARGYGPHVATLAESPLAHAARQRGFDTFVLQDNVYFSPRTSKQIHKWILDRQIEAVLVHQLRDLWLLRPALMGLPNITVVGFAHMFLQGIKKTDPLHRWLYSRLKVLVALTQTQKNELLKCLPVDDEQVVVIPNGVDFQKFSPKNRDLNLREQLFQVDASQPVVGVIGRLDPQKGQLEFLMAARHVLQQIPNAVFALIGRPNSDGQDYLEKIKKFIAENELQNSVRLIDHINDVRGAMAALDILVLPSYKEAFGNVLIEAMASGVPIIATNAGGPSEIIQSGVTGLLVPPHDEGALAHGILSYLRHPQIARLYANNALAFGAKKYEVNLVFNALESLVNGNSFNAGNTIQSPEHHAC